jgi:hypothetical protein
MKSIFRSLDLVSLVIVLVGTTACNASQVSGTYVAHGATFAEMLQLTHTSDGQLSGVLSHIELKQDGSISAEQTPVSGTADAGQLTLKFPTVLSFIQGKSLAGTVSGNIIQLQMVDSNGNVSSEAFERNSPSKFTAYAGEMKSKGQRIAYSNKLMNISQQYRATVRSAENWIANAEAHAQRIPNAKADYEKIETEMESLVARERATSNPVTRSQIAVAVTQGDIAGGQVDIQVHQVWDIGIGNSGSELAKVFAGWDGNCGTDQQLQKQGATDQARATWDAACKEVVAERAKFDPIYKRMSEQRAGLKSFQATAQAHRKALVAEADHMQ